MQIYLQGFPIFFCGHYFTWLNKIRRGMGDVLLGMPLKYISLATLVIQNSALVLVMRYSRTLTGPSYLPATAVR
jgi:UDP-sugar transporter A1/2/3